MSARARNFLELVSVWREWCVDPRDAFWAEHYEQKVRDRAGYFIAGESS
jgi:hypothetical protein